MSRPRQALDTNKQAYMAYNLRLSIMAEVYWSKIKTIL